MLKVGDEQKVHQFTSLS